MDRLLRRSRSDHLRLLRHDHQPQRQAEDLSAAGEDYSTDVYSSLAVRALKAAQRSGKPLYMSLAPNAPHTVAVASSATQEGSPAVPPPRYKNVFARTPLPAWPNFDEADMSDKTNFVRQVFDPLTGREISQLTDQYRGRMGALLGVDDLVERVVNALKRLGVYDNTDIIFTSDNGWILGEHRLKDPTSEQGLTTGVKFFPFEGSSRVPRLAAGPDFPAE